MSHNISENIWIIGAGQMAVDYAKVLNGLGVAFNVIGRGEVSARNFEEKIDVKVVRGGLQNWLKENPSKPEYCIVALPVNVLAENTGSLLEFGIKKILVEKPAGLDYSQIKDLRDKSVQKKANVLVAYNRRFLTSVLKAEEIIAEDGGVTSFNFEFTEWGHVIEKLSKPKEILKNWFLANSTHIVDMAFFIGGTPTTLKTMSSGKLSWHPKSKFVGCGITDKNALFSYAANWDAPGRWVVEILTRNNRLLFKPIEKLQIQKRGSVKVDFVVLDDSLDIDYKPGLFLQTKAFISNSWSRFKTIEEQEATFKNVYNKILS